jgi:hypothetical protein
MTLTAKQLTDALAKLEATGCTLTLDEYVERILTPSVSAFAETERAKWEREDPEGYKREVRNFNRRLKYAQRKKIGLDGE